jgi:hypothetical protein
MGQAHTRVYRKGILGGEDVLVADVSGYLAQPDTLVWVAGGRSDETFTADALSSNGNRAAHRWWTQPSSYWSNSPAEVTAGSSRERT